MKTKIWLPVLIAAVLAPVLFGPVLARESEDAVKLYEKTVTIIGKGEEALVIAELRYLVTEMTVMEGPSGSAVTLDELKVPCVAEVEYYYPQEGEGPILASVKVIRYLPYASAAPSAEMRRSGSTGAAR